MPTIPELMTIRSNAMKRHLGWKQRSLTTDLILQNKWNTVWADMKVEEADPTIENVYSEAMEDKAGSAASSFPFIDVAATRGTRDDRAERVAQQRRRAFVSFTLDSNFDVNQTAWVMDWLKEGAMYSMPWSLPDDPVRPFSVRHDPRFVYPVSHDARNRLSSCIIVRNRTVGDLLSDYPDGEYNGARLRRILGQWQDGDPRKLDRDIEELWYYDDNVWAVAIVNASARDRMGQFRYVSPMQVQMDGGAAEYLIEPHPHRLVRCPVVERKKVTGTGEYRGALDGMIPNLKHAHNLTAQLLLDVTRNIFAPIVAEGLENPEDIGPDAILLGDGSGNASIEYPRPPVNFEALQHVASQLVAARNVGAFPQQRSGDFGASIASAKGVNSVMGQYNTQQGWAQRDLAGFYRDTLARLAEYDEYWCGGEPKEIDGFDEGEMFTDKYDPARFWKGDYRVFVRFMGEGQDKQSHTIQLATLRNMGIISARTFMRESGVVPNALQEERDQALETRNMGYQAWLTQQAAGGNILPWQEFSEMLDDDKETVSSATSKAIRTAFAIPTEGPAAQAGGGNGDPGAAILAARSLTAGGIPGNAEGLPPPSVGPELAGVLPPGVGRAIGEVAPGGTAT